MKNILHKSALGLGLAAFVAVFALAPTMASADSLSVTVSLNSSCVGYVDGQTTKTVNVTSGSAVSLTARNGDTVVVENVSGPGIPAGTQLQPDGKNATDSVKTFALGAISDPVTITFTPVPNSYNGPEFGNNCPIGSSPQASQLVLNPVAPAPAPAPTVTHSSSSSSAAKPAATTPAPTATTPAASSTTPTAAKAANSTPSETPSRTTKIVVGSLIALLVALAAASLMGYVPYRRYWNRLRGKKAPAKRSRRRPSRRKRK